MPTWVKTLLSVLLIAGLYALFGTPAGAPVEKAPDVTAVTDAKKAELPDLPEVCRSPKPTIVVFGADWCGYCRKLDEEVLNDPRVKERLAKYVVQHVNIDNQPELGLKAKVNGVPQTFLISADCKTVSQFGGYAPADVFLKWLDVVEATSPPP